MSLRRALLPWLAALVAIALLALVPVAARANGVPTLVDLTYIDLSNWGPEDANGTAELIFAEGIVRLDAQGLPQLAGRRYQAWLVNSESGDAISAGRFNANAVGVVNFEGSLPPIADFGFDLFIITVEDEPDDAPQPSTDRSIGGYFALVGPSGTDGQNEAGSVQPGELPDTGESPLGADLVRLLLLGGVMGFSVLVGMRLARRST